MARLTSTHDELQHLTRFLIHVAKKDLWVALAWALLYFCTQWVTEGPTSLFSLPIGVAAGIVIGWWLAEDAVETAGFSGLLLWTILVIAAWLPIAVVEGLLGVVTGWSMGFGRWMLFTAALIMSLVAAVWRASADD